MGKYERKRKSNKKPVIILILIVLVLLAAILLMIFRLKDRTADESVETVPTTEEPFVLQVQQAEKLEHSLGRGLIVQEAGKYIGVYMEDGTDEVLSDVLMLIVRNDGLEDIQYVELTVPTSAGDARFSLSTLPAGESMVVLEKNRMLWSDGEDYSQITASNLAYFSEPMSLHEDQLKLQILDGVINIVNVSGEDIAGDIIIYYKNASSDLLYGGITYRVRLEGGLKADEVRQIMANHFSENGSRIMFVTIG